jgi:hypothetical protein
MTETLADSIQAVVALLNKMTKDYAAAHGRAVYSGAVVDDGWDELPGQISDANKQLNDVWSSTKSHAEHRHIRGVEEGLGELHDSSTRVAGATTNYLTVEAAMKQKIQTDPNVDTVDLEMARNKLEKADQSLEKARSNLVNYVGYLT